MGFEILPNIVNPLVVVGTLRMGTMMVMEASLSFLGIGIPPRIPTWGSMIQDGYRFILNAWWLSTFPGLVLVALVLSVNLVGEGLREVLDPDLQTF
jgi:peptide/nickel transport system permease protein